MRFTNLVLVPIAGGLLSLVAACPGNGDVMGDLERALPKQRRQSNQEKVDNFDSNELIGDLITVGAVTPVAKQIKGVILGTIDPYSDETYTVPGPKGSQRCSADTCCIWSYISAELAAKFRGPSGRCNGFARAAVRMGFHDAGAWNKSFLYGGADGSLILANEITRAENKGLQQIISYTESVYSRYRQYGVGMADLIQMSATVATVVCPLGPRVRTYVGRVDSERPAPDGLLPSVFADANSLINLFKAKTIKEHGLAALVGAHSTSQQQFVDPSRAFDPQDSTPGVWDVLFYRETLLPKSQISARVFKFQSDVVLSQHPNIAPEWRKFASGGQEDWNEDFAREYVRLSLLGVNRINYLTECTKVLPSAIRKFEWFDRQWVVRWLAGMYHQLGPYIETAVHINMGLLKSLGYNETDPPGPIDLSNHNKRRLAKRKAVHPVKLPLRDGETPSRRKERGAEVPPIARRI